MRILMFALLFAICFTSVPQKPQAAEFSGSYLLRLCDMDKNGREKVKGGHTACQAYISGIIDYHMILQSFDIAPEIDLCIPEKAGIEDLHLVVLTFLHEHSEHDAFIAAPAVTMALYNKYGC